MLFKTKGLVLREVKIGEADKILTLLTPENGVISVFAKASMRPKNRLFAAAGLFAYSEWVLFAGKTMAKANEATPIELFFNLRQNLEAVSLAAYIAEVLQLLSPTGAEGESLLRLALNCLYVLAQTATPPKLVKAVFELRTLQEAGFVPDVLACECGKNIPANCCLDTANGKLYCESCCEKQAKQLNLDAAGYAALKHILYAEMASIFKFNLKNVSLANLSAIAQAAMLSNLGYQPKALAFLKTLII